MGVLDATDVNTLEFVEQVQHFYTAEDYVSALTAIATAEAEGKVTLELLLLKAACIQMSGNTDYPLSKALEIYEFILKRRPTDVRALAEAGFFLLNVQDDAVAAQDYFARAVRASSESLAEALVGLGNAKRESGCSPEAVRNEIEETLERLTRTTVQGLLHKKSTK